MNKVSGVLAVVGAVARTGSGLLDTVIGCDWSSRDWLRNYDVITFVLVEDLFLVRI